MLEPSVVNAVAMFNTNLNSDVIIFKQNVYKIITFFYLLNYDQG